MPALAGRGGPRRGAAFYTVQGMPSKRTGPQGQNTDPPERRRELVQLYVTATEKRKLQRAAKLENFPHYTSQIRDEAIKRADRIIAKHRKGKTQ